MLRRPRLGLLRASRRIVWVALSLAAGACDSRETADHGADPQGDDAGRGSARDHADGGAPADAGMAGAAAQAGQGGSGDLGDAGAAGDGAAGDAAARDGGGSIAPIDVPAFENGSRLRARVWAGSDGSRHFAGFRDTDLDLDCAFARIGADHFRCIPLRSASIGMGVYVDDQCTERGVQHDPACAPRPDYVPVVEESFGCDRRLPEVRVDALGEPLDTAYQSQRCEAVPPNDSVDWYAVAPADPSVFAQATLESVALGGGLAVQLFEAGDGARKVLGLTFEGHECSPHAFTGESTRCAPVPHLVRASFYSDRACTKQNVAILPIGSDCAFSPLGVRVEPDPSDSCKEVTRLVAIEAPERDVVYRRDGDDCGSVPGGASTLLRHVTIGDTVDSDVLPALELTRTGGPRLQIDAVRTDNGSEVPIVSGEFYDRELGRTCTPQLFEDGLYRCVPADAHILEDFFGNAACTEPVAGIGPCFRPEYVAEHAESSCRERDVVQRLYRVIGTHADEVYSRANDGTCTLVDASGTFAALEPFDVADLVVMTEELE